MRRRVAVRKQDIHREEQRRAKGARPYKVLPDDTIDENGNIVIGGMDKKEKPVAKKEPAAKEKPAAKKKVVKKKAAAKKEA